MKVLSLSSDCAVLNKLSLTSKRAVQYGALVDQYFILVPAGKNVKQDLSDKVIAYGVNVDFLNKILGRVLVLSKIYRLAKKIIGEEKIDIITAQDPFEIGLIGYLLARKFKIGFNVQLHGDFFGNNFWKKENILNLGRYYLGRALIKKADSIRTVSARIKNSLLAKLQISPEKIINAPIFTDYDLTVEQIVKNDPQEFTFLSAGRLVKSKNFSLLLKVFSQIAKDNDKVRLIIQGSGPEEDKLKAESRKLQVDNKITFLPYSAEGLKESYLGADCFVLSSNHEGWGLVVIEASLYNLPVIMTDVGCSGEIVKNNESGLVAPVGDEEALKNALLKMMKLNHDEKNKFIINVKENIAKLPNKEETLKRYYQSWQAAIDQAQLKYTGKNLLFVTQKVDRNDGVLGFVHQWLKEFSARLDRVTVICLQAGEYDLPKNVKVISLGKENGYHRIKLLLNYLRALWRERNNYQNVLAHMAPLYLLFGGLFWRIKAKKIGLFYAHRQVDFKLWLAEKFADFIFTSNPETFKLTSKKVNFVGQAVDLANLKPLVDKKFVTSQEIMTVVLVARIGRAKQQDLLLRAVKLIHAGALARIKVVLVGGPTTKDDQEYENDLRVLADEPLLKGSVEFVGQVSFPRIAEYYSRADLTVQLCSICGIDKTFLESWACGVPCLAVNRAILSLLSGFENDFFLEKETSEILAEKIIKFYNLSAPEKQRLSEVFLEKSKTHSFGNLIEKILNKYQKNI